MSQNFKKILKKIAEGKNSEKKDMKNAFNMIMDGKISPIQISAFLTALKYKGETVDDITAAVEVVRRKSLKIATPKGSIDTAGTGGDGLGTFNISTAAAFVAAACGVPVAKHGNKAQTSRSGSSDFLSALGAKLDLSPINLSRCIEQTNICFMFAPNHHKSFKYVGPVRQELGFRTIFNLVGPLSNPGNVKNQLLGVFSRMWVKPISEVLMRLKVKKAWVVHGSDGSDEISVTGPTYIAELSLNKIKTFLFNPKKYGIKICKIKNVKGGTPEENAKIFKNIINGKIDSYRDMVIINSAAALVVANKVKNISQGIEMSTNAIDTGLVKQTLNNFVNFTNNC